MDNKKNGIPKLRFPGFTGAWEQRKLGEVAEINPSSEIPDNFEYVDIESVVGTEMIAYRRENKKTAPSRAQRLAKKGDIFYQTVRPYQKNNYHFNLTRKDFVFSTGYAQLRPNINGDFLFVYIQLSNFVNEVLNRSTGTSYPAISPSNLIRMKVAIPTNNEQEKIGAFFKQLDSLIALHQRKLEHLQEQKKGLLQKMFPKNGEVVPEVRFPGFTDAWEQRKLGEITSVITKGTTPLDKSGKGSINFVKVEDLSPDNSGINVHSMISKEEHEGRLKRSILKENDILFSIAGTLGRIGIVKSEILPANTNQALAIVRLKEGNLSYISTVLEGRTVREYIRQNPTVGAQPNLSLKQVSELRISFPTLQEQEQVGNFFNKLNSFIALHQRKLDHLELMKKGLLQQMFV